MIMDALTRKKPTTTANLSSTTQRNHSTRHAAEKILGAVMLQPQLADCIPPAIHARFSCYGRFVVKSCAEGWGIEGIRNALDSFGLDGDDIVSACLSAVRGDPAFNFWHAARQLCERGAA